MKINPTKELTFLFRLFLSDLGQFCLSLMFWDLLDSLFASLFADWGFSFARGAWTKPDTRLLANFSLGAA